MISLKSKAGQAQVIVTVLIILLVVIVVGIVYTVVTNTVREGAGDIEASLECFDIKLVIDGLQVGTVQVLRQGGGGEIAGYKVIINGSSSDVTGLEYPLGSVIGPLETDTYTNENITIGAKVEIAAVLANEDQTLCEISDSRTVGGF